MEATIEKVEELIDAGYFKILLDRENNLFKMGIWNGEEYI